MKKILTYGLYYGKWKVNGFIVEKTETTIKTKSNETNKKPKENPKYN